jgi:hypothetical protein
MEGGRAVIDKLASIGIACCAAVVGFAVGVNLFGDAHPLPPLICGAGAAFVACWIFFPRERGLK